MNIFDNRYFVIPVIAWAIAQTLKVIIELLINREFNAHRFVGSGGMPSSHSALVMGLTTTLAIDLGWNDPITAVAFIFALVVMYDAAGVRRAAGKQAKILNLIISELQQGNKLVDEKEKLKELLGHTPVEVIAGALLGFLVPYLF
ncbi:divergent PAP2 family protein [Alkalicella caledoniensis]|uniref:Divergent PAP2 family protein n=1 Tax=Alkalicella caledoniensis TaxID=2731377 RepID=A0A7G9WBV0_ALKCA|nr:divergent PAP2 family protein [Alkalicella caledoniensis]QNO16162.1 divergent PAP2 family protein [Alkalicella caledoniensis]